MVMLEKKTKQASVENTYTHDKGGGVNGDSD